MKREKPSEGKSTFRLPTLTQDLVEFLEEHERNVPIDEHDLVSCQKQQTESYDAVGRRAAFEASKRDAAKQHLKMVSARVEDRIRADAKDEGEKVTEATVAARVLLDPDVIEAETILQDLNRAVRDLEALRDSFQQRSVMLRDMAQLWIAGYYGDSATAGADRAVRAINAKDAKREIAKRHRDK